MKRFGQKTQTLLLFVSIFVLSSCDNFSSEPGQIKLEPFTLKLHWIPDSHQLGFWVALDKGFYAAEGLDVTIHPGGMDANPIRDVVSGSADIGQIGGIEQAITAVAEGLPVKAVAAIHRQTPHALISLSRDPINSAEDIAGKTIAVAFGDTAELLLKAYMSENQIDESSVRLVPYRFDLRSLVAGQVDAVTGFSTGQPVTLEEQGLSPVVLEYSSAGISSYGYTLVTSNENLSTKRESIEKFLEASREGWEYAFQNPEDSISIFVARFGDSVSAERSRKELNLIKSLMLDNNDELDTWILDAQKVQAVSELLSQFGEQPLSVEADQVIDNTLLR